MITSGKDNPGSQANAPASRAHAEHGQNNLGPNARIVVVCPGCKATLSVRQTYVGNVVRCKQCRHEFRVQAEQTEQRDPRDELIANLGSELAAARAEVDRLSVQFELRQSELQCAYDQLQGEHVELTGQLDRSRLEVAASRGECERLSQQLAECSNELRLAGDVERQLRDRNQELVAAQTERELAFETSLKGERTERQRLEEEVLSLCAKVDASDRADSQVAADAPDQSALPDALASELDAARSEAREMTRKLNDAEYRNRLMSETLSILGVTFDLKPWSQGSEQKAR